MHIQTMTEAQAANFRWNPFDLTKVWPHAEFPLQRVGKFELNRNPENYFAEVEQAAFSPGNVVPGISWSPDRMLQARIMSYPDSHRYRLGVNYETLPVNHPHATTPNTPYQDGLMRSDGNNGARINYHPTHQDYPQVDPAAKERPYHVEAGLADRIPLDDEDYFDQARMLYDIFTPEAKERLYETIAGSLGKCSQIVQDHQMALFRKVSEELADRTLAAIANIKPPQPNPQPGSI
jgi:catalase